MVNCVRLEAMGLQLPGQQIVVGDLDLFLLRVAEKLQDLHAVPEGGRNRIQHVGGGDEHHLGQVEADLEIMIGERGILLRVQDLEEGGSGIAAKIGADLVDFVQDKDGVVAAGPADALDDAAGHGPDVGPAVAADFGFIPHPAQGEADKLAPQGPGDGFTQGGFAGTRRADKTQDGTFHIRFQFAHRQKFQDAFLHLFRL